MKKLLAPLASLRLTIALLAMAIVLVYAGTWAQVDTGVWTVQKRYFHSLSVWISFQSLLPRPKPGQWAIPGGMPWPGGYMLGGLMLINLLAAHLVRFKLSWKRSGIILIHAGLALLLIGELLTSVLASEGEMPITEGSTAIYSQDIRTCELAVIDPSPSDKDLVISFPQSMLREGRTLHHDLMPFDIRVDEFQPNSQIFGPMQPKPAGVTAKATAGSDQTVAMQGLPQVSGTDAGVPDFPSAYVSLTADGQNLGRFLVSSQRDQPQEVRVGDKLFRLALRFRRDYKPYSVTLLKFTHEKYLGSNIDLKFSSKVQLIDPQAGVNRTVVISMNDPLRYRGETFYQAGAPNDQTTVLQVVKNPVSFLPYLACVIGALGLLIHFGIMLFKAIQRRTTAGSSAPRATQGEADPMPEEDYSLLSIGIPAGFGLMAIAFIAIMGYIATKPSPAGGFDQKSFGNLPVSFDGRTMPFESLARDALKVISGRQYTWAGPGEDSQAWANTPFDHWELVGADRWLLDVLASKDSGADYRVFRIDNPEVLGVLDVELDRTPRLYSFREIQPHIQSLIDQANRAAQIPEGKRSAFDRKVIEVSDHVQLYLRLQQLGDLYLVPPLSAGEQWKPITQFLPSDTNPRPAQTPASELINNILADHYSNDTRQFNVDLISYQSLLESHLPKADRVVHFEAFFDRFDPFWQAWIVYILLFTLGFLSWLAWGKTLSRSAFVLLLIGLGLHTFGLGSRIYISGRPPVTNLYSSAIFIAWAVMVFAVGLELYFRNTVAMVCASAVGFIAVMIAPHLDSDGDTMGQLRAVLDTNGWLATHVVTVTLGYSATFLAGVLAVAYIILGVFTPILTAPKEGRAESDSPAKLLPRMVYGILCFAILFSFVGTVLGGIWADQSWGRFWGWDPKENGAVLIVLWNALVLHARWAGVVRQRGLMLLAVFGNVITSWSWFGTNMLGVGLHSYGFMDSQLVWLLVFVFSQLAIISLGGLPLRLWQSFSDSTPLPTAPPPLPNTPANPSLGL